jgi:hypothetical protein
MENKPTSPITKMGLFALAEERGHYNKCHTMPNANAVKIQLSASSRFVMPIR